ncbi:uncharacterized protein MONOS_5087 [Monocercomonoides exilis]|uniref:uncharacterized protein n=1 Tax=Monocercomonoides exilis TaxID=2049356 RepID=UPI003559C3E9|nr:hypothetical protein MONOS_5087 [Monocercomonoides exilis]
MESCAKIYQACKTQRKDMNMIPNATDDVQIERELLWGSPSGRKIELERMKKDMEFERQEKEKKRQKRMEMIKKKQLIEKIIAGRRNRFSICEENELYDCFSSQTFKDSDNEKPVKERSSKIENTSLLRNNLSTASGIYSKIGSTVNSKSLTSQLIPLLPLSLIDEKKETLEKDPISFSILSSNSPVLPISLQNQLLFSSQTTFRHNRRQNCAAGTTAFSERYQKLIEPGEQHTQRCRRANNPFGKTAFGKSRGISRSQSVFLLHPHTFISTARNKTDAPYKGGDMKMHTERRLLSYKSGEKEEKEEKERIQEKSFIEPAFSAVSTVHTRRSCFDFKGDKQTENVLAAEMQPAVMTHSGAPVLFEGDGVTIRHAADVMVFSEWLKGEENKRRREEEAKRKMEEEEEERMLKVQKRREEWRNRLKYRQELRQKRAEYVGEPFAVTKQKRSATSLRMASSASPSPDAKQSNHMKQSLAHTASSSSSSSSSSFPSLSRSNFVSSSSPPHPTTTTTTTSSSSSSSSSLVTSADTFSIASPKELLSTQPSKQNALSTPIHSPINSSSSSSFFPSSSSLSSPPPSLSSSSSSSSSSPSSLHSRAFIVYLQYKRRVLAALKKEEESRSAALAAKQTEIECRAKAAGRAVTRVELRELEKQAAKDEAEREERRKEVEYELEMANPYALEERKKQLERELEEEKRKAEEEDEEEEKGKENKEEKDSSNANEHYEEANEEGDEEEKGKKKEKSKNDDEDDDGNECEEKEEEDELVSGERRGKKGNEEGEGEEEEEEREGEGNENERREEENEEEERKNVMLRILFGREKRKEDEKSKEKEHITEGEEGEEDGYDGYEGEEEEAEEEEKEEADASYERVIEEEVEDEY